MHLTLVQPDVAWEDRPATFERVQALLESNPPPPAGLIVLPEMFAVGFSMNVDAIHEGPNRPTEAFLAGLARRYKAFVLGGLVSRDVDGRGLNEALAVDPDGRPLARYVKLHPFSYAGETNHYNRGDRIVTFPWHGFTVAPFICYDLRFPEIYRVATARGANLLVTIANFPSARVQHWVQLLIARAIENQAYVVGVNRSGSDPNVAYPGRSLVVDPLGDVLADAGPDPTVVHATVSLDDVTAYRARFPALQDMRSDLLSIRADEPDQAASRP